MCVAANVCFHLMESCLEPLGEDDLAGVAATPFGSRGVLPNAASCFQKKRPPSPTLSTPSAPHTLRRTKAVVREDVT